MAEQLTPLQLVEVLREDRRRRWQNGDRILAEAYLQRHPALHTDPDCALELIYHEVLLREELGEAPRLEEYLQRFPQFAARLEPLFEVHQAIEGGGLVDPHATTPTAGGTLAELPPPLIPGYEVLNLLGRGGMGVVYRARHERLNRIVALKMIRAGAQASPEELARFRTEAAVQAQLQHPHIVQIFEVGEAAGGPYFALEFIDGLSLDKQTAGKPQPARAAAELVQTLARAVHHAHEKALVHRDLKPGNILVTADGTPKVGDFGLAKRLEGEAGQTQSGAVVGTANYMAPEQAWGRVREVGPAADIHALGAILYELLTGRPPFLGATPLDTLLQVRHQEPVPPRRWLVNVPRDLETICLKCLRKEPAQRYRSALALADDLQRFLNGEPIQARPVGAWERGVKWARRRPAVTALLAILLVVLVGGFFGMMGLWLRAETARQGEATQRGLAEEAHDRAEQEKQVAEAVRNFLQRDLLQQADATEQANALLQAGGGFEIQENPTIKELLARAAAELAPGKIEVKFPQQPEVQASILRTVGNTYRGLGEFDKAVDFLSRSSDTYQHVFGADHPDTLTTLHDLAIAYSAAGRTAEAIALYEQVRDAKVQKLGADHPRTLATQNNLAGVYRAAGKTAEAIALYEQVRDARVQKLGADHPDTLATLDSLAVAYRAAGKTAEAIALYEQVRDARVQKLGADHPDTLTTLNNLAVAYGIAGKTAEAIALFERVRDARVTKLGADHPDTLTTLADLAGAYLNAGQTIAAIDLFEQVRDAQVRKLGADHPYTLATLNNLALAYRFAERTAAAIDLFEQVRDAQVRKLGADHPRTLTTLDNLAGAYYYAGKTAAAIDLFKQVRDARVQQLGADHPDTLTTLNNLAMAYLKAGKTAAAIDLFEQVRDVRVQQLGADHPDTLTTLNNLAVAYRAAGKLERAPPLFQQAALGIEKRRFRQASAGRVLDNLSDCHERLKQYEPAEVWRRKWLAVVKEREGPESPAYAGALAGLGLNLLRQQKHAEAEKTLRDCVALRAKQQPDAWTTFDTQSLLGEALAGQQKYAEAEPLLLAGYEGMKTRVKSIPLESKLRLTEALDRLVQLYDAWGKKDQAEQWRKRRQAEPAPKPKPD